jgi:site-specific recombinase XerD
MRDGKSIDGTLTQANTGPHSPPADAEYQALLTSFVRHLKAERKSPSTVRAYRDSVATLGEYLARQGMPRRPSGITREHVESFMVAQLETLSDSTARTRFAGCRVFFNWLVDEGELTTSPMARMKAPKVGDSPPPVLSDPHIKQLLKACAGRSFRDRRDLAIIRLLLDTGMRRSELAGLQMTDVDLDAQLATVHGKGDRVRLCPFGAKATQALDRYQRMRAGHRLSHLPAWWLGHLGGLTGAGVYGIVTRRAQQAGLPRHIWPHLFRHTAASNWLEQGGQEGDLMRLAGWHSVQMMRKYGRAEADRRAIKAFRELSPGDRY